MKILVTGGAGFIGSHFVRWLLNHRPSDPILNLDKLTYAGNLESLKEVESHPRYRFIQGDVADSKIVAQAIQEVDAVVHFAAETHVDRSIVSATDFLRTNVEGTHVLLEAARRAGVQRFVHISTDEVYGSLETGAADEKARLSPNSPYAASKAAGDLLAQAFHATYQTPVLVIRASNNFGPYQFPEKFLPLMITQAIDGGPLPIYGDGLYVREWLFVEDFCEAVGLLMERGIIGEVYNVGSGNHHQNIAVAREVLKLLGKPESLLRHVTDRPGHDRRYAVDSQKVMALGWKPRHRFEDALAETVRWYEGHPGWWRPLKSRFQNPVSW